MFYCIVLLIVLVVPVVICKHGQLSFLSMGQIDVGMIAVTVITSRDRHYKL